MSYFKRQAKKHILFLASKPVSLMFKFPSASQNEQLKDSQHKSYNIIQVKE